MLEKLVATSFAVAETRSRKEKIARIAALFREVSAEEIALAASYLAGDLPQGKIGVGWAAIKKARDESNAAPVSSLTISEVDRAFGDVAATSGAGSTGKRRDLLGALFCRATATEQTFLARLLGGELRQGALESIVVDAIAQANDIPAADVRRAVMFAGSVGKIAEVARREGAAGLAAFDLVLFRPVQPMLASPADDVEATLAALGRCSFELKLDGARVQIHKQGDEVRVYSRLLNEVTPRVPEVVEAIRAVPIDTLVLDGEAIALQPDRSPHPFQVTMRRFGRKSDASEIKNQLPLSLYVFDCLHAAGRSLMDATQEERVAELRRLVPERVVPSIITDDVEQAEHEFQAALAAGHEGLIAKSLAAPYAAGRRGKEWLKLKSAHTLDLVILGVEWGSGRRQGWLSNLHLGARHGDHFVMLGKTFKGLSDETLKWQTETLLALETKRDGHIVYVRPELVAEIAFNDVQDSPHYPGGLALRFARVKRYRPDKRAADADTLDTVRAIHQRGHKKS